MRSESPERYESYVDIGIEEWIHLKLVVLGSRALFYVNDAAQPALVVNDLKHGPKQRGGVGFWIESGTVGYFSELRIQHEAS